MVNCLRSFLSSCHRVSSCHDGVPRMYPELPPPSYAESVWGVANVRHAEDEHTKGDWEFVPRYVTYNTQY